MSCGDARAQAALDALFTGEVGDEELMFLRAHAESCDACRAVYDRTTHARAQMEGTPVSLPKERLAFLEKQVLARVAQAEAAEVAASKARAAASARPFWLRLWMLPAGGLAVAGLAVALLMPRGNGPEDGWQARGVDDGTSFGIRAFCVAPGAPPKVLAEAAPGGRLACAPGQALQFTYTAPVQARLAIVALAESDGGEPLHVLSSSEPHARIAPGVDVSLPFSTPVSADWLTAPLAVKATFLDEDGKTVAESALTVVPASARE